MVRITIDAKLSERLVHLREPAELFTAEGRRVGHFLPDGPVALTLAQAREADLCPFSDEELEEMRSDRSEGRPLTEIWKDLGRQ